MGSRCKIGDRSKLNNVLVMRGVEIRSNTVLQNSIVGVGARIGENCNLKDCQVGPWCVVPAGTKTVERRGGGNSAECVTAKEYDAAGD